MPGPAPAGNQRLQALAAACVVGTIAFAVYTRTLLPGVDAGDTGGFQAAVLWPETSARRGYPLYYALAKPFVALLTPAEPARGLNLFSALAGGLAVGLLTFVASLVTRSRLAGAVAGLLLAFSYTFWTQAVIAEVYTLHLALIGACLAALVGYERHPSIRRLAIFFAVYALAFGNHLGMILLLLPFGAFIVAASPNRREIFRPKVIAMAIAIACGGALQYLPNLLWTWTSLDAPADSAGRLAAFWIDTTKADWREAMVMGVERSQIADRVAMWWWDTRQQFGVLGIAAAATGAIRLWWTARPWAVLVCLAYATTTLFALTYNVGDTHVFFLPAHFIAALAIAPAIAPAARFRQATIGLALCALLLVYAGWRGWDTYPAADRHLDRRPDALAARLTAGLDERDAVLLSRMNWEPENVLLYTARWERRNLAWIRLAPVLPHLPYLVRDNRAIGRDVVLTAEAAADVVTMFGPVFPVVRDEQPAAPSLTEIVTQIPRGLPYVLTRLTPLPDESLNEEEFSSAVAILTGETGPAAVRDVPGTASADAPRYQVWAGRSGTAPVIHRTSNRPFTATFSILGDGFSVRMDSWLPSDTFRRGGFGHVLRGRDRLLFVERGVSLVWFRPDGSPAAAYTANVYEPRPRFRIPALPPPQLAEAGQTTP